MKRNKLSTHNQSLSPQRCSMATRAIHGRKLFAYRGPVASPIFQTTTYRFSNSRDAIRYAQGDPDVYVYTRYHNPTVTEVEERLALMNGTERALLFSSGMAAITCSILALVESGDEIISTAALYGGTYRFFRDILPRYGIRVRYIPPKDVSAIEKITTKRTKLVYFESPTNPTLQIVDIDALVRHTRVAQRKIGKPKAIRC